MSTDLTDQLGVLGEILDHLLQPVTLGELADGATVVPANASEAPDPSLLDSAPEHSRRPRLALGIAASLVLVVGGSAVLANRPNRVSTRVSVAGSPSISADEPTPPVGSITPTTELSPNINADDAFEVMRSSSVVAGNMQVSMGTPIQTCMAEKGFRFAPTAPEGDIVQSDADFLRRRYASPYEQAGKWGYIFDTVSSTADNGPIETPSPDSDKPGFYEAMTGRVVATSTVTDSSGRESNKSTVGDGCYGQVASAIFGSAQNYLNFIDRINQIETTSAEAWSALALSEGNRGWVACMKQRGFDYPNFLRPHDSEWPSPRPSDEESRIASADAACRGANHLTDNELKRAENDILVTILERHPLTRDAEFDRMFPALIAGPVTVPGA
jgi:hypothetical protein